MQLDPVVRDYPGFLDELIQCVAAPTTRIYLDTSLLMWLIRISDAARADFFAWAASRREGSVRVPVWAAHELHRHLGAKTVAANVKKALADVAGKYDEFLELAAERAEDGASRRSGFTDRIDYLTALNVSQAQFKRLQKAVSLEEQQARLASAEVVTFANRLMMDSDTSAILSRLQPVGQFRYDHRVPPGFQDKKEENQFGDVIIWEEMLDDMAAARLTAKGALRRQPAATDAIFLSRDKKTDWVTAAAWLSGVEAEPIKSNRELDMDVSLPHPLLQHEFRRRCGAGRVFVTHPAFLSTVLDLASRRAGTGPAVPAWVSATRKPHLVAQIESRLQPFSNPAPPPVPPGAPPPQTAATPPTRHQTDWEILTVRDLTGGSVTSIVSGIVQGLPGDRATEQESLIRELVEGARSAVDLGAIFAELIVARAPGWPETLPMVLEGIFDRSPDDTPRIMAALLVAALFDRYGELRAQPRKDVLRAALALELDARFSGAFGAFRRLVQDAGAALPYFPGSRAMVAYSLDLGPAPAPLRLQAVRLASESVMIDDLPSGSDRSLSTLLGRPPERGCSGEELRLLVAKEYLIPPDRLSSESDKKRLTWTDGAGLKPLDAQGDGGFGAEFDVEDYD